DGDYDMVNEVGSMLEQFQMTPVRGSRRLWEPRAQTPSRATTSRSRLSRETEVSLIHRYQRSPMILSHAVADEGALLLNPLADPQRTFQFIHEMRPTTGYAGFALARSREEKQDALDFLERLAANQQGELDALVRLTALADKSLT